MIYITTYHDSINYGAALQSYALQNYLKNIGYESKLIKIKKSVKPWKKRFKLIKTNASGFIKLIITDVFRFINRKEIEKGEKNFQEFFAKYHNTTNEYNSFEELKLNPPVSDMYISGSDQVFNPLAKKPWFFLEFGGENVRRISYAASVGIDTVPEDKKDLFKNGLKNFDVISVRESESKELVEKYYGKKVSVNVDPTLLIRQKEWDAIKNDSYCAGIKKSYALVYAFYTPKWLSKKLREIHKNTGLDIVVLSYNGFVKIYHNKIIMNAGPAEFLKLVSEADMIISSSYHGCIFSMIYEKPFYAVVNTNAKTRISSLLSLFDLKKRVLSEDTRIDMDIDIDYNNIKNKIERERERTKEYLTKAIEGEVYEY